MKQPFRLTAVHAIGIFVACFAVIIAVNATFVTLALRSFPGEDEPKSYAQGVHYNDTLRDRAQQAALGWTAVAALDGDRAAPRVELIVRDKAGAPIDGLTISGALKRPTQAKLDRAIVFAAEGRGRYVARLEPLPPGKWTLAARASKADQHFDVGKQLIWGQT